MRYSLNFLVPLIILAAPVAGLAQSRAYSMWAGPRPRKRSGAWASSSARRGKNFLLDVEPPRKVRSSMRSSARPATGRTGREGSPTSW